MHTTIRTSTGLGQSVESPTVPRSNLRPRLHIDPKRGCRPAVALGLCLFLGAFGGFSSPPDLSSAATSSPSAQPTGLIGHSGRWLVDSEGRVLIPHGVNFVVKNA